MTTDIKPEELAERLALAMGWVESRHYENDHLEFKWLDIVNGREFYEWNPHLSHDHANLATDECFRRGLGINYVSELARSFNPPIKPYIPFETYCATPLQKSIAALIVLEAHKSTTPSN